jgi:aminoglycoside 6-adenylyltransferase
MADKISIFRSYDLLIEEFVKWAEPRPDIRAAMIIGSRARIDRPADEWADLDMVIVTTNPGQYVSTADWVKNMGNPLLTFMELTAGGDENERRVLYEGMLDVDFAIFPAEKMKQFQQGRLSPQIEMQIANAVG